MRLKKGVAAVLAAALTLSSALNVFAATNSQTTGNDVVKVDDNTEDHSGNTVVASVKGKTATVTKCTGDTTSAGKAVEFKVASGADGNKVAITAIGNGKAGVFDSKAGRRVTSVKINSTAKTVTIKKNAFKNSKVKVVKVQTKKLVINKNAFNGTKQKKVTLRFMSGSKKASAVKVAKGALKGLTKITVKGLNNKQYKKLVKKLTKAGYKGKVVKK